MWNVNEFITSLLPNISFLVWARWLHSTKIGQIEVENLSSRCTKYDKLSEYTDSTRTWGGKSFFKIYKIWQTVRIHWQYSHLRWRIFRQDVRNMTNCQNTLTVLTLEVDNLSSRYMNGSSVYDHSSNKEQILIMQLVYYNPLSRAHHQSS